MHAGKVLHQNSFHPLLPIPFQQLRSFMVMMGITHLTPNKQKPHAPLLTHDTS